MALENSPPPPHDVSNGLSQAALDWLWDHQASPES